MSALRYLFESAPATKPAFRTYLRIGIMQACIAFRIMNACTPLVALASIDRPAAALQSLLAIFLAPRLRTGIPVRYYLFAAI